MGGDAGKARSLLGAIMDRVVQVAESHARR